MKHENVYELFDRTARKFGANIAISRGGQTITYGELQMQANRFASFLNSSGASKGALVAFVLQDSIQAIATIIGALKAGCVFVPIEPELPERRLKMMIDSVSPEWIVIEPGSLERIEAASLNGTRPRVICVDDGETVGHNEGVLKFRNDGEGSVGGGASGVAWEPDDMCYIYFTSGSTGRPKAIAGRLKGIDHFIRWEIEELEVASSWRVSQLLPLSFDGSLRDVFVPLCAGATVCVPEGREVLLEPRKLLAWLEGEQINLMHCVPSLFRA